MIYTSSAHDTELLAFSREMVRDALRALRNSEAIARQQRARDALARASASSEKPEQP